MLASAADTHQLSSGEEIRVISYTTTYREQGREEGGEVDTEEEEESARCRGTEKGLGEGERKRRGRVGCWRVSECERQRRSERDLRVDKRDAGLNLQEHKTTGWRVLLFSWGVSNETKGEKVETDTLGSREGGAEGRG